jgi:hypothetical protein
MSSFELRSSAILRQWSYRLAKAEYALHRSADGSEEQAAEWAIAFNQMPISLRSGLSNLNEIRALSQELWPHKDDWLCAARIKRCDTNDGQHPSQ